MGTAKKKTHGGSRRPPRALSGPRLSEILRQSPGWLTLLILLTTELFAEDPTRRRLILIVVLLIWFVVLLIRLLWNNRDRLADIVKGMGKPVVVAVLGSASVYAHLLWRDISERQAARARHAVIAVANSASLSDLAQILESTPDSVATPAGLDRLEEILADESLTYAHRGSAAISLARLGDSERVKTALTQAFTYQGDPSLRWWVLGATPLWLSKENLPVLLELTNARLRHPLSEESQIRSGAIAALAIAGPEKFRDEELHSKIATTLAQTQKETLGQNAALDNLIHWALKRFNWKSYKEDAVPGRPPEFGWYANLAGLTMIRLKDVKLERPGVTQALAPYYLADTEVTISTFQRFVEETQYKTTAEQRGGSSGLDFNYQWSKLKAASWKSVGLPGDARYIHPQLPVVHVSWIDAAHFCNWLSKLEALEPYYQIEGDEVRLRKETKGYRLPTRGEWTCAALADTRTSFWWGRYEYLMEPDWRKDRDWGAMVANLPDRSIQCMEIVDAIAADDAFTFAAPVASFCPNPLGFFDIIGNAGEWCDWDEWDAEDKRTGTNKPIAGGSWGDELRFCTWRHAREDDMTSSHVNVGFRVARNAH